MANKRIKPYCRRPSELSTSILRDTLYTLKSNVRKDIQYNHIKNKTGWIDSSIQKFILDLLFKDYDDVCKDISLSNDKSKETLEFIDNITDMIDSNNLLTKKEGSTIVRALNNIKLKAKHVNLITSYESMFLPKNQLYIPKNSDLASEEYRKFIAKPTILETVLTSIVSGYFHNSFSPVLYSGENIKYSIFGTKILTKRNRQDPVARAVTYTSYIAEYNSYKAITNENINKYKYMMYFDISKYFTNIDHTILIDILAEYLVKSNSNKSLTKFNYIKLLNNIFKFKYIDDNGNIQIMDKGLTVESHTQHATANIYMMNIMKNIIDNFFCKDKIEIVSYVDDFVIFSDNKEAILNIFNFIKANFKSVNLEIAENKTSDVLDTTIDRDKVKQLVRLPSKNYMELDDTLDFTKLKSHNYGTSVEDFDNFVITTKNNIVDFNEFNNTLYRFREHRMYKEGYYDYEKLKQKIYDDVDECIDKGILTLGGVIDSIADKGYINERYYRLLGNIALSRINMHRSAKDNADLEPHVWRSAKYKSFELYKIYSSQRSIIERLTHSFNYDPNVPNKLQGIPITSEDILAHNHYYQKDLMKFMDESYIVCNYEKFANFDLDLFNKTIDNINDNNILKSLQYIYMTVDSNINNDIENDIEESIKRLACFIIQKYPSKIRFLVSIIKKYNSYSYKRKENKFDSYINLVYDCVSSLNYNLDNVIVYENKNVIEGNKIKFYIKENSSIKIDNDELLEKIKKLVGSVDLMYKRKPHSVSNTYFIYRAIQKFISFK